MRKIFAMLAITAGVLIGTAGGASAHTGHVSLSENCESVHVEVTLDNNVSADRSVTVTSNITGVVSDVTDAHYDTTGNSGPQTIFTATVDSDNGGLVGDVTLTIDNGEKSEWSETQHISGDDSCIIHDCDHDSDFCPPPVETPPSTTATVDCNTVTVNWADFPNATPEVIHAAVNYADGTSASHDINTSAGPNAGANAAGSESFTSATTKDQPYVVHVFADFSEGAVAVYDGSGDLHCAVATSSTTVVAPTLPVGTPEGDELAYTGDMTMTYTGIAAAAILAGLLLLGVFRKGPFRNSTVLFGKIASA